VPDPNVGCRLLTPAGGSKLSKFSQPTTHAKRFKTTSNPNTCIAKFNVYTRIYSEVPWRCGSPERQGIATPAVVHLPAFRQLHPRVSVRMATETGSAHAATLESTLGQVQGSLRRPTGTRFVKTTINSTAMSPYRHM
jgi:hypothetical protein